MKVPLLGGRRIQIGRVNMLFFGCIVRLLTLNACCFVCSVRFVGECVVSGVIVKDCSASMPRLSLGE